MRAFVCILAKLALRHYRDPLSWAGLITAVGAATHTALAPEYVTGIETILGSIVAMLLFAADGRSNPNTDTSTGVIAPRVQGQSSDTTAVQPGDAGQSGPVQPEPGTAVRPGTDPAIAAGTRPGFGPY